MKVVVYILCYDAKSRASAEAEYGEHEWARILDLPPSPNSKYMEGAAFLGLLQGREDEWKDADFVGTLSWKASGKISVVDMQQLCQHAEHADVLALLPSGDPLVNQAIQAHPRFLQVWIPTLMELGYSLSDAIHHEMPAFFCNYWLAKPTWLRRFLEFYTKAVQVLETHQPIQEALWSCPNYCTALPQETCMKIYEKPYIPYHPFVGERLACFYFWKEQATVALTPLGKREFWKIHYEAELEDVCFRAENTSKEFCPV